MSLIIIHKSILDADEQYIAQQCNCITTQSAGLSKSLFDKFPYANTYINRTKPDSLGSISIMGNGKDKRFIINMYAQFRPGKPKFPPDFDSYKERQFAFQKCLDNILLIPNIESIAFPYRIGCGLAGGNWDIYFNMIEKFSLNIKTSIYQEIKYG